METNNVLVNPRTLEVGYRKVKPHPYGAKVYFPFVGRMIEEVPCVTATEAHGEAKRIWAALCEEYDKAILEMSSSSPAVTEEEQVVAE